MFPPPSRRVRLAEIAIQANCTVATVSMALNGSARLPETTRERIQSIARKMGYVPNSLAKSLSLGRSGILGAAMPFATDPYYAGILDALSLEASERGYQLQVHFHRWSTGEEDKALRRLVEARVDGILLYPARSDYSGTEIVEWLRTADIPAVLLGRYPALPGTDMVTPDYEKEGLILGQELLRMGYRRIDTLSDELLEEGDPKRKRYESLSRIAATCPDAEIPYSFAPTLPARYGIPPALYESLLEQEIETYLQSARPGTAVITNNHKVAWKILEMMRRKGLQCPPDLAIVSNGILGTGAEGSFPLTSIEYDPAEIASLAIGALLRRVADRADFTGEMLVSPRLMIRETTAALPACLPKQPASPRRGGRREFPEKNRPFPERQTPSPSPSKP